MFTRAEAVFVFGLYSGEWYQVGSKLVGEGEIGRAGLGYSVPFATWPHSTWLLAGGPYHNGNVGAAWIFLGH